MTRAPFCGTDRAFERVIGDNGYAASTANEAARTTAAKRSRPGLTPIPNTSRNGG